MSPDDVPAPSWSRPAAGSRAVLGPEAIAREALRIIDDEGVEAVSMRKVAAAFDTGPASLYAHVANKDALLRLALDLALDELEVPEVRPGDTWQDVLRRWAMNSHEVLSSHRDLAKLTFAHIPSGPAMLATVEALLAALIEGGVPARVASWALDIISLYVGADAYEGWVFGQRLGGSENAPQAAEFFAGLRDTFSALPPERFPYLVANVGVLMEGGGEARFEFGLDLLIGGIAATATRQA